VVCTKWQFEAPRTTSLLLTGEERLNHILTIPLVEDRSMGLDLGGSIGDQNDYSALCPCLRIVVGRVLVGCCLQLLLTSELILRRLPDARPRSISI
jgi:hypothetical protein